MTDNTKSTLWALAVVALLAALVVLAFAARSAYTPPGDLPLTVTAVASLSPASLTATSPPTDTDTATAYLTATPAATDTPEPPTATMTPPPSPTQELGCTAIDWLNVRNVPSVSGARLRLLAPDEWVLVDVSQGRVERDGITWIPLDGGGWAASDWLLCG